MFKQYLAAGAVVNEWVWIRAHGTSQLPLNLAVQEGHKEIVELIIAKGTDVNAKGGIGGGDSFGGDSFACCGYGRLQ